MLKRTQTNLTIRSRKNKKEKPTKILRTQIEKNKNCFKIIKQRQHHQQLDGEKVNYIETIVWSQNDKKNNYSKCFSVVSNWVELGKNLIFATG